MRNNAAKFETTRTVVLYLMMIFGCIYITSCAPIPAGPPILPPEQPEVYSEEVIDTYVLHAGDELEISVYRNNDLDQRVKVLPDGTISLLIIGEVEVAGITVAELTAILRERYSEELFNPQVNVVVTEAESNIVFVGGGVRQPAAVRFDDRITVLQAISLAGGVNTRTALLDRVLVIRRLPGQAPQRYLVDLTKIIDGSDLEQDIYLIRFDTVYVPSRPQTR